MKFKSTIIDIPTFTRIAQSLALLSKQAWIRLTPESVQFIVQPSGTQVWATIDIDTMFSSYSVESNAENVINLELNVDSLGRLLRNMSSEGGQVSMKLTKRDRYPMLSFTLNYFGKQGGQNTVTHDLHVRVLSSAFISGINEPEVPEPDVVVMLPGLPQLAQISGSLRTLSDKLVVAANMDGEFSIGIATPAVTTNTLFRGLLNPALAPTDRDARDRPEPSQARESSEFCRLKVDAKDWCNLLRIGSVAKRVIACFCESHAIVLYVYVTEPEPGEEEGRSSVLTYYIATYQD